MDYNDIISKMDYVDAIMIVDNNGKIVYSVRYNPRFEDSETREEYVNIINKNFLEIYPEMNPEESTVLTSIEEGVPIYEEEQSFTDYKGRITTTQNLTIPIIRRGKILGAIELSKDITKSSDIKKVNKKINRFRDRNRFNFEDIITDNVEMKVNIEKAKKVANNPSTILIYGETGTGKELFVQSIHNYGNRKDKPFIVQNCASLPENLFESILFGTSVGAFTGAMDKPGLFELANGGTLFLDEINSMPISLQAKLLRVLQDGKVRRVGGNKEEYFDVRVIAAMNREPMEAIELNEIREDLFYRLSVVSLKLIPLRYRKEDIPLYIDYFIEIYNEKLNKNILGVTKEVMGLFIKYNWPGNVRELEHIIESAINFVEGDYIEISHLPIYLTSSIVEEVDYSEEIGQNMSLDNSLDRLEKELIIRALEKTGNNITKAAELLKITRQSLHYKMNKYNI